MKDEPCTACRCIEYGLQSPHQINWDTDEDTVAVVEPGVDECDHQRLKCGCCMARSGESVAADAGQQNILTQYAERASVSTGHDPGRSRDLGRTLPG